MMLERQLEPETSPPGEDAVSPRLVDVDQVVPSVRPAAPVPAPPGGGGDRFESRFAEDAYDSSDTELGAQLGLQAPENQVHFPPPIGLHRQAPEVRPAPLEPYFRSNDRGYDDAEESEKMSDRKSYVSDEFLKENLPPLMDNELEFEIKDCHKYTCTTSVRSEPKTVGNFRFRLLIFPSGTQSTGGAQVSAFVEAYPLENLDPRWCFPGVKYQINLVNWLDYRRSITKSDNWSFSKDGIDRGWHDIVRVADLTQDTGWVGPSNTLYFRASCYVRSAEQLSLPNDYSCKKETGFTGLKNHGATCYMNGLLQSLFHVGEFRKIVYCIEGEDGQEDGDGLEDDSKPPQLIQALQNVFYKLQTSDQAVNCRELMKSFGWDTTDAFTQHDAQELNRILCDRLEERMKNTPSDGSIKRLFEGEMENYIECIDVDYSSRRNETFYDIQLNIKSERGQELQTIVESLHDFTSEETLEGDNAYEAEGHGKQRAKKGIRFLRFPPLLNLQLKRFHFDLEKMDMVKLNSRFEFPRKLDLSPFAPDGGKYDLFAVVVHNGDVNSGHYYAHIQPDPDRGWFKFDDEHVTPCSEYAAIEDNYGGSDLNVWNYFERSPSELHSMAQLNGGRSHLSTASALAQRTGGAAFSRARSHNAYMLMYIREDLRSEILKPPDPKEVNPKMVERCDRDVRLAEQRRREKVEQQTKIKIKLAYERHLTTMTGFWDHTLVPCEKVYKLGRDQLVRDFVEDLSVEFDVHQNHIALFVLQYRTSPRQIRFGHMQPHSLFKTHIPQYGQPHFDVADPSLTVLMILSRGYSLENFTWEREAASLEMADSLSQWSDDRAAMLVVKYFCVETRRIVTLGCFYMVNSELLIKMVECGWLSERLRPYVENEKVAPIDLSNPLDINWECWEEFSEREMQTRNLKRGVKAEQLYSGDILIWQVAKAADDSEVLLEDGIAPVYPVYTVADLCTNQLNVVDVTVLLHDRMQPLCVDGMVANGHWGPLRAAPVSEEGAHERPEDAALALSPVTFFRAKEKEIRMDFRWNVQHVVRSICSRFELSEKPGETGLWLFHAPPSCTAEEALNTPPIREQTTLKELQRSLSYLSTNSKRQLTLHVVELPFQPGGAILQQGLCPLCIRFFDDRVCEVGSEVIFVPNDGNVQDVLAEAQRHLKPEWGISSPLRAIECADARVNKVYRPDHPVRGLASYCRGNIFFHCLRIEADQVGTPGQRLMEIFHCDRASQQAFGQPLLMMIAAGEKSGSIKQRCKAKLQVPDAEFKSWRLVRCSKSGSSRVHLKDDEAYDVDGASDLRLCLEHVHPNPLNSLSRQSRHNKPLTIKA